MELVTSLGRQSQTGLHQPCSMCHGPVPALFHPLNVGSLTPGASAPPAPILILLILLSERNTPYLALELLSSCSLACLTTTLPNQHFHTCLLHRELCPSLPPFSQWKHNPGGPQKSALNSSLTHAVKLVLQDL